jgi:hypothetical protein
MDPTCTRLFIAPRSVDREDALTFDATYAIKYASSFSGEPKNIVAKLHKMN